MNPARPVALCVVGTRPEVIKMAPVVHALGSETGGFDVKLCVTAQHRDLLDPVLEVFGLTADVDLNVMRPGQKLSDLTAALFAGLGDVIRRYEPAWVVVQGDTTSALVGAIGAFYERARVAHVEAGLRTNNLAEPFPEELNRSLIGRVADAHFAPTRRARANLLAEGVNANAIHVTGNTAIDALRWALAQPPPTPIPELTGPDRLIFVTLHRRESFGEPLTNMCRALAEIARAYPHVRMVLPVHPNPHVGPVIREVLGACPNVRLTTPLDYVTTIHTMERAHLVVTDSGGIQEEAPSLGTPVLVLRNTTERPEGVEAGVARLVGTDPDRIVEAIRLLLDDHDEHARMANAVNPYGDGTAAEQIARVLASAPPGPR